MNKLRLAVVGAGHLGKIHTRLLSGLEGVELIGVVDPVENQRVQVAAEYGIRPFADHRELIGKVDGAVIAAPTKLHHQVGLDLLWHGIHLLIEKPLASTVAESNELVREARSSGVVLQVGHIERFNPAFTAVQPHLRAPKFIEAARFSGFTGRSTDIGAVLDLMIHDIDLVLALAASPVRRVEALGVSVLGGHEDAANARLVFENGCVANLSASRISYRMLRKMQVWCQGCQANIDFAARTATVVRPNQSILERKFSVDRLSSDERGRLKDHLFEDHMHVQEIQAPPADAITAELTDFRDSINTRRQPRVTGADGRDALAVAEMILSEIASHSWDGTEHGPRGPLASPTPSILTGPHWDLKPSHTPNPLREAG